MRHEQSIEVLQMRDYTTAVTEYPNIDEMLVEVNSEEAGVITISTCGPDEAPDGVHEGYEFDLTPDGADWLAFRLSHAAREARRSKDA